MQSIIVTTPSDLKKIIFEAMEEHSKELLSSIQNGENRTYKGVKYYTRKETARELNITLPTLNKYVKNGLISCRKIGARVLFSKDDIISATIKRDF
jgi:excisionase family DNA binding protein